MWRNVDLQALEREDNAWHGPRTSRQVESIVVLARLELYNRGLPCGAIALRRHLHEQIRLQPLPSVRRIGTILTRYGLTHGRTGWYPGEQPDWLPQSAWVHPAERRTLPHFDRSNP